MSFTSWYGSIVRKYNIPILFIGSFLCGSAIELVMIKWRVGETNFYDTFKEKETRKAALKLIEQEQKSIF